MPEIRYLDTLFKKEEVCVCFSVTLEHAFNVDYCVSVMVTESCEGALISAAFSRRGGEERWEHFKQGMKLVSVV